MVVYHPHAETAHTTLAHRYTLPYTYLGARLTPSPGTVALRVKRLSMVWASVPGTYYAYDEGAPRFVRGWERRSGATR